MNFNIDKWSGYKSYGIKLSQIEDDKDISSFNIAHSNNHMWISAFKNHFNSFYFILFSFSSYTLYGQKMYSNNYIISIRVTEKGSNIFIEASNNISLKFRLYWDMKLKKGVYG